MLQESLNNVIQHAGAQHAWVELEFTGTDLSVQIRDDGKGIAPGVLEKGRRSGHYGLPGMRERAGRQATSASQSRG